MAQEQPSRRGRRLTATVTDLDIAIQRAFLIGVLLPGMVKRYEASKSYEDVARSYVMLQKLNLIMMLPVIMVLPMTNEIATQVIWSVVAENDPCIVGRATPTDFQVKA